MECAQQNWNSLNVGDGPYRAPVQSVRSQVVMTSV